MAERLKNVSTMFQAMSSGRPFSVNLFLGGARGPAPPQECSKSRSHLCTTRTFKRQGDLTKNLNCNARGKKHKRLADKCTAPFRKDLEALQHTVKYRAKKRKLGDLKQGRKKNASTKPHCACSSTFTDHHLHSRRQVKYFYERKNC